MARGDRPRGAPCHAHDLAECCGREICTDCEITERCEDH